MNASQKLLDETWKSEASRRVLAQVEAVGKRDLTVLLVGETGAGKEVVAHALHEWSGRSAKKFVAQNCAALAETLLESELFGHKRGSFTGANDDKKGLFETADGGTLFLDEITETSPTLQSKLLRVLQEGEIRHVGAAASQRVDVRAIVATNRDVEAEVARGRFRADLYHRVSTVTIEIPPLRERVDDIGPIPSILLAKAAKRHGRSPVPELTREALAALRRHDWPGNVRELEHALDRAVALGDGGRTHIEPSDLRLSYEQVLKEQYASLAVIKRGDGAVLVTGNMNWNAMFLPGARLPRPDAGNLRSALVGRLRAELDLEEGAHYRIDGVLDVDLVQPSAREGINKLYHFRLFTLKMALGAAALEDHLHTRTRFGWMPLGGGVTLDTPTLRAIRVSPTFARLMRARVDDRRSGALALVDLPASFDGTGGDSTMPPLWPVAPASVTPCEEPHAAEPAEAVVPIVAPDGDAQPDEQADAHWSGSLRKYAEAKQEVLEKLDRRYFTALYEQTGGNITRAAEIADMERVHLRAHLRKLGIHVK